MQERLKKLNESLWRVAGAAGLVFGFASLGLVAYETQQVRELQDRLSANERQTEGLTNELLQNLIGDCANENVLRSALGYSRIGLDGCRDERYDWLQKLNEGQFPDG